MALLFAPSFPSPQLHVALTPRNCPVTEIYWEDIAPYLQCGQCDRYITRYGVQTGNMGFAPVFDVFDWSWGFRQEVLNQHLKELKNLWRCAQCALPTHTLRCLFPNHEQICCGGACEAFYRLVDWQKARREANLFTHNFAQMYVKVLSVYDEHFPRLLEFELDGMHFDTSEYFAAADLILGRRAF